MTPTRTQKNPFDIFVLIDEVAIAKFDAELGLRRRLLPSVKTLETAAHRRLSAPGEQTPLMAYVSAKDKDGNLLLDGVGAEGLRAFFGFDVGGTPMNPIVRTVDPKRIWDMFLDPDEHPEASQLWELLGKDVLSDEPLPQAVQLRILDARSAFVFWHEIMASESFREVMADRCVRVWPMLCDSPATVMADSVHSVGRVPEGLSSMKLLGESAFMTELVADWQDFETWADQTYLKAFDREEFRNRYKTTKTAPVWNWAETRIGSWLGLKAADSYIAIMERGFMGPWLWDIWSQRTERCLSEVLSVTNRLYDGEPVTLVAVPQADGSIIEHPVTPTPIKHSNFEKYRVILRNIVLMGFCTPFLEEKTPKHLLKNDTLIHMPAGYGDKSVVYVPKKFLKLMPHRSEWVAYMKEFKVARQTHSVAPTRPDVPLERIVAQNFYRRHLMDRLVELEPSVTTPMLMDQWGCLSLSQLFFSREIVAANLAFPVSATTEGWTDEYVQAITWVQIFRQGLVDDGTALSFLRTWGLIAEEYRFAPTLGLQHLSGEMVMGLFTMMAPDANRFSTFFKLQSFEQNDISKTHYDVLGTQETTFFGLSQMMLANLLVGGRFEETTLPESLNTFLHVTQICDLKSPTFGVSHYELMRAWRSAHPTAGADAVDGFWHKTATQMYTQNRLSALLAALLPPTYIDIRKSFFLSVDMKNSPFVLKPAKDRDTAVREKLAKAFIEACVMLEVETDRFDPMSHVDSSLQQNLPVPVRKAFHDCRLAGDINDYTYPNNTMVDLSARIFPAPDPKLSEEGREAQANQAMRLLSFAQSLSDELFTGVIDTTKLPANTNSIMASSLAITPERAAEILKTMPLFDEMKHQPRAPTARFPKLVDQHLAGRLLFKLLALQHTGAIKPGFVEIHQPELLPFMAGGPRSPTYRAAAFKITLSDAYRHGLALDWLFDARRHPTEQMPIADIIMTWVDEHRAQSPRFAVPYLKAVVASLAPAREEIRLSMERISKFSASCGVPMSSWSKEGLAAFDGFALGVLMEQQRKAIQDSYQSLTPQERLLMDRCGPDYKIGVKHNPRARPSISPQSIHRAAWGADHPAPQFGIPAVPVVSATATSPATKAVAADGIRSSLHRVKALMAAKAKAATLDPSTDPTPPDLPQGPGPGGAPDSSATDAPEQQPSSTSSGAVDAVNSVDAVKEAVSIAASEVVALESTAVAVVRVDGQEQASEPLPPAHQAPPDFGTDVAPVEDHGGGAEHPVQAEVLADAGVPAEYLNSTATDLLIVKGSLDGSMPLAAADAAEQEQPALEPCDQVSEVIEVSHGPAPVKSVAGEPPVMVQGQDATGEYPSPWAAEVDDEGGVPSMVSAAADEDAVVDPKFPESAGSSPPQKPVVLVDYGASEATTIGCSEPVNVEPRLVAAHSADDGGGGPPLPKPPAAEHALRHHVIQPKPPSVIEPDPPNCGHVWHAIHGGDGGPGMHAKADTLTLHARSHGLLMVAWSVDSQGVSGAGCVSEVVNASKNSAGAKDVAAPALPSMLWQSGAADSFKTSRLPVAAAGMICDNRANHVKNSVVQGLGPWSASAINIFTASAATGWPADRPTTSSWVVLTGYGPEEWPPPSNFNRQGGPDQAFFWTFPCLRRDVSDRSRSDAGACVSACHAGCDGAPPGVLRPRSRDPPIMPP